MMDVMIRGEEVTVVFRDNGYESDTGSHVIEWEFESREDAQRFCDLSKLELEAIDRQIYDREPQAEWDE